ncbi:hypothetical protein ACKI2N_007095 [Cupriavidus sp. 30B13]|uniref:hypothetical protein n=1 Tax=Cupriavidus sp. 30B13 TaxID=3384241 RepID=UPI003B913F31
MNLRLSPLLVSGVLVCASLACAAEPRADAAADAGCASMLAVVQRSLEEELGTACPAPASIPAAATACAAQQEPLRAIADYIATRRAADADACETLLEVNKRLRTLPPKN